MNYNIGDTYPVWWNTGEPMVDGFYPATIIKVLPYTGKFDFTAVLRLTAPGTKRGWLEMTV